MDKNLKKVLLVEDLAFWLNVYKHQLEGTIEDIEVIRALSSDDLPSLIAVNDIHAVIIDIHPESDNFSLNDFADFLHERNIQLILMGSEDESSVISSLEEITYAVYVKRALEKGALEAAVKAVLEIP